MDASNRKIVRQVACRALLVSLAVALRADGFQCYSPDIGRGQYHATTSTTPSTSLPLRHSAPSNSTTGSDDIAMDDANAELSTSELRTLFKLLSDTTILYDPSRGTCCRNKCSGCTFLDPANGNFIYDEHTADGDSNELGGWLAPYVKVDFGERVHISRWSQLLFSDTQPAKEIERDEFATLLLLDESTVSPLALQSLWTVISPSAGYPKLSLTEITRAINGMEGSSYDMGGAVTYNVFETNMRIAAQTIVQLGGVDKLCASDTATLDYDSMSKEELLEECLSRGMSTTFPKMKRIIIEELRFFDANGRQGKRHPVKNTLS